MDNLFFSSSSSLLFSSSSSSSSSLSSSSPSSALKRNNSHDDDNDDNDNDDLFGNLILVHPTSTTTTCSALTSISTPTPIPTTPTPTPTTTTTTALPTPKHHTSQTKVFTQDPSSSIIHAADSTTPLTSLARMQLLSPAAELTANSLSWPHPSSPSPHQDLGAAQDDDALGFGSFESVFITEKDLERAKEKLPEDEHKTAEESFHDVIAKLSSFHITGPITLENRELFSNAILCCDFVELSRGRLEVGKDAMLWTGITPTFSTQSKETDEWQLYILSENITNVRTKQVAEPSEKTLECSTAVMLTINETIFVQFLFDADRASACFKAILARKGQDSNLDGTIHPDTSLASGQPLFTSTSVASPAELPFLHPIHPNSSATNNAPTPSIPSVIESDLDETFRSAKQALKDARDKALESIEEAFQKGLRELYASFRFAEVPLAVELELDQDGSEEGGVKEIKSVEGTESETIREEAVECGICCDERVTLRLKPCGHALCRACYDRIKAMDEAKSSSAPTNVFKCPFDRNEVLNVEDICVE